MSNFGSSVILYFQGPLLDILSKLGFGVAHWNNFSVLLISHDSLITTLFQ